MSEKTNDKLKEKQPLPWWRRILLVLVLTVIGLLTVSIAVSYLMGKQLSAEIVKISQAGEPLTFSDLEADIIQSSTAEDAARYYVEALLNARPGELANLKRANTSYRNNITSLPAGEFPDELREEVTQNLERSQPVLENLDKGAGIPLSRFNIGIVYGIKAFRTRLLRLQTASFLLSLRTLDLIRRGEGDTAVDSIISMLKMTRTLDFHPTFVLHTSKISFVLFACEDIGLLLEHSYPSEKSLAKLQKVLLEIIPANALERMFLVERVYQIEIARDLIPENITTSRLLQGKVPDLPERLSLPAAFLVRLRIRQKVVRYLRDMAQIITAARRPWPEPWDAIVDNALKAEEKPSRLISSSAASVRLTTQALVAVRCTILAIVIERYRRSHGELPSSLDEVLPTYINSIPLDPFTGKKLLYSHDEETYVVYSTGINRQDDGGSIKSKADEKRPLDLGLRIRFRELR